MFYFLLDLKFSLSLLQNPVSDHLPVNTIKLSESAHTSRECPLIPHLALSGDAPTVRLSRYLPTLPETHSVAVFVGAMARGRDDFADHVVDEKISISDFPLSASVACGKVSALRHYLD
jgi:rRNA small subunit pseudouridine methyltransferase Nep1